MRSSWRPAGTRSRSRGRARDIHIGGDSMGSWSRSRGVLAMAIAAAASTLMTTPVSAHHEALFGPQSSAALTWPDFASVQIFDTQKGKDDRKTHTTTTVFSGGFTPFHFPVSIA